MTLTSYDVDAFSRFSILTDLISEAKATKDALDDAYQSIEKLNEATRAAPAPAPSSNYDSDLFGFDVSTAPIPQQQTQLGGASSEDPAHQASHDRSLEDHHQDQENVSSFGSDSNKQNIHRSNAYHSYDSSAAASGGGYGLGTTSSGYMEGEGIMGGAPAPLPSDNPYGTPGYSNGGVPTAAEIADLKKKLREAQDVAREAEESKRQVVAHAEELRRLADEAEDTARKYQNQPESSKKKGLFGKKKVVEKDPVRTLSWVVWLMVVPGLYVTSHHSCLRWLLSISERGGTPGFGSQGKEG
jgi:hypothetical protein